MKKIFSALLCVSLVAASGAAFAAPATLASGASTSSATGPTIRGGADQTAANSTTTGTIIGRLSKGVKLVVVFDAVNGASYALATKHDGGTNLYGTAYNSTSMYMKTVGSTALAGTDVSGSNADAFATGWTAM